MTIDEHDFVQAFDDYNRADNFSRAARRALYEYLTQCEEDAGEELELDPIAVCCDYSEYESAYEAMQEYQPEDMPVEGEDGDDLLEVQAKNEKAAREWLEEQTMVIDIEGGGVVIESF